MRHFRREEIEQRHRNSPDEYWYSKKSARQQIESSRERIAASTELLIKLAPSEGPRQVHAMLTHAECRAFARVFKAKAAETDTSARTTAIMNNIAHSLSGLASQLEMLTETNGHIEQGT
jgi:hypothetical protein